MLLYSILKRSDYMRNVLCDSAYSCKGWLWKWTRFDFNMLRNLSHARWIVLVFNSRFFCHVTIVFWMFVSVIVDIFCFPLWL